MNNQDIATPDANSYVHGEEANLARAASYCQARLKETSDAWSLTECYVSAHETDQPLHPITVLKT